MADKNFGVKGIDFISDPGTPTISIASSTIAYAGSLNLNAPTVAISTDLSIGGKVVSNLVVSNDYSVGIGTTVLTGKLNVNGNVNISGIVSSTGFVGSGVSLTGVLKDQSSTIDTNVYQYLLVTPQTSGTISSVSSSYNYIVFNPSAKYLGIGTDTPAAGLDVNGTGRFTGTVTAPTFQGNAATASTASGLTTTASVNTSGIITATGGFVGSLTGIASTASGLTTTANVNTSGIITATGGFVGGLTGIASTASGLTTTASINTSGIITATGGFVGGLTGTATTATQLETTRYFSVSGDVSTGSSVAFNGTQNVGLAVTLALSGVTSATYGSTTSIPSISVNDKGIITGVTTSGITVGNGTLSLGVSGTGLIGSTSFTADQNTNSTFTVTSNATSLNTGSTIVARDASGNFRAGIITATTFSGTATTATTLTADANVNTTGIITAKTFSTGISTENVGFTTGIISGPNIIYINPYQIGVSTGTVRILGNLIVEGTTVTTTEANLVSSAKKIGIAVSETSNIVLDGAGIGIGSALIEKTLLWNYGSSSLKSSENFNLAIGKVYQINDNPVLSSTELASTVITASGITSVGTLQRLVVSSNTSTDAVRITQTGSGNALVVEDNTNPDGTPFVVSADGSVGIGTTNPTSKLTVQGDAYITGLSTFSSTVTVSGNTSNINLSNNNSLTFNNNSFAINHSGENASISNGSGDLIIGADNNRSIRLERVGVATLAKFTHSGSAELYFNGVKTFETVGSGATVNGTLFTNQLFASGIITATDFNSTSDINLKTNIQQIDNSLSKVIQIRGVTFDWKDTNRSSAGVIAQEVENVLPELVNGEETKTVNYNGVIGALVEAVKELKVENDIMKQRLDEVYKKVFG